MPTPAKLRALSAQGKKIREEREAAGRKEQERKWREERMEQAAKDHAEAKIKIGNLEYSMERAAEDGQNSIRVKQVYVEHLSGLEGVDKIIANHFKKEGYEVDIETCDGPDIKFEPDYIHYLRISW